jgi:hypothetical protein
MAMPSKSKKSSKERPMNSGIIRTALTTTLALELEYREPPIFREIGTESERPTDLQHQGDCLKMSLYASLSVI